MTTQKTEKPSEEKKSKSTTKKKTTSGKSKSTTAKKTTSARKTKSTSAGTKKNRAKKQEDNTVELTVNEEKVENKEGPVQEAEFEVIDEQPAAEKTAPEKPVANFFNEVEKLAKDGFAVLKKTADKIMEFSSEATELTKLKLEHKKYVDEKEALIKKLGEHVWRLQKENALKDLDTKFSDIFAALDELEKKIAAKKEEIEKIQLL